MRWKMNNLVNNMREGDKSVIILWQYAFNIGKWQFHFSRCHA